MARDASRDAFDAHEHKVRPGLVPVASVVGCRLREVEPGAAVVQHDVNWVAGGRAAHLSAHEQRQVPRPEVQERDALLVALLELAHALAERLRHPDGVVQLLGHPANNVDHRFWVDARRRWRAIPLLCPAGEAFAVASGRRSAGRRHDDSVGSGHRGVRSSDALACPPGGAGACTAAAAAGRPAARKGRRAASASQLPCGQRLAGRRQPRRPARHRPHPVAEPARAGGRDAGRRSARRGARGCARAPRVRLLATAAGSR
mmetsp:Transcript_25099/g.94868  ORF Transcript_25099/g.94868 Transcript_25099/m.94868 type:complete len:259 (+) Transcript_25099:1317-2093(+)